MPRMAQNSQHQQNHGKISSTVHRGRARPLLNTHDFQSSGRPRWKGHSSNPHYAFCASRSRSTSNGTRSGYGTRPSHCQRHPSATGNLDCCHEDPNMQPPKQQRHFLLLDSWSHHQQQPHQCLVSKTSRRPRSHRHQDQHNGRLAPRLRLLGKRDG